VALLEVDRLSVSYGGVRALEGVSLRVEPGTLVGLIGSNGAGKTTALDALTGFASATGSARMGGHDLLGLPAHARARLGMTRTWQAVELFDDMTVRENFQVASSSPTVLQLLRGVLRRSRFDETRATQVLGDLGVPDVLGLKPTQLSQGQRKVVGLARALMKRPVLLLADEPAAGLDTQESSRLGSQLRRLVDDGLSMVLVDHDMQLVLTICDYIYVLDHGQLIAEGTPAAVRDNDTVIEAYLGRPEAAAATDGQGATP
jgi:branched-chain amino acid transport system ATP-binding protein